MESAMRSGILGSLGALLAAAPLSLAADPPLPAVLPALPAFSADVPAAPLTAPTLPSQLPTEPLTTTPQPGPAAANPPAAAPQNAPTQQSSTAPAGAGCQPATKEAWHDTHCGPRYQTWFDGGYRAMWNKDARIATPLVTSGPSILSGGEDVNFGTFQGFYLDGGLWFDCRHHLGVEFNGFYFGSQSVTSTFASDAAGNPTITRPIIDALTFRPVNVIVSTADPALGGPVAGAVSVRNTSLLGGLGANGVMNLSHHEDYTVDYLMGFRYIDLEERLNVGQVSTPLFPGTMLLGGVPLPPGVGVSLTDDFHTRNQFYGGLVGTRGEMRFGPTFVSLLSTVALGPNHQTVDINGYTTALTPGGRTLSGGLLAVGQGIQTVLGPDGNPSAFVKQGNLGRVTTNRFIVVPEVGVEAGLYVTSHVRLAVGYNFLYMTDVARPGRQVDPYVNPRFVPSSPAFGSLSGAQLPMVTGAREDFHAHMVQFSAEVRY
jgi:hypothetical protein